MKRKRPMIDLVCKQCNKEFPIERYRAKSGEGMYCTRQCYYAARSRKDAEKFWANTEFTDTGCRKWKGRPLKNLGYGRLRIHGKTVRAHRYAYELTYGEIPDGMMVLHKCDNPICVNPEHLFLGDAQDNMQDMANKGRAAGQRRLGEKHPMAKITDKQAEQIKSRYVRRDIGIKSNVKELSEEFGVSQAVIFSIYHGTRKSISPPTGSTS